MRFFKNIIDKFAGKPVDWDELEEALIRSDIGVPMTLRILKTLREREAWSWVTANDIAEVARDEIGRVLPINPPPIRPLPEHPKDILIVGVNGTGKTTSAAKLAHFFKTRCHTVLLAAADTFRAAAIEQLGIWADRIGVDMIRGEYNADPAWLCYEALCRNGRETGGLCRIRRTRIYREYVIAWRKSSLYSIIPSEASNLTVGHVLSDDREVPRSEPDWRFLRGSG